MNIALLRVLRTVIRADSDPARQALFAKVRQSHLTVRLVYGFHSWIRGTWASAMLVSSYGLASYATTDASANHPARVLAVARHANARRQVARVVSWVGPAECDSVRTTAFARTGGALLELFRSRSRVVQALRIIRAIDARHGFLVSCRVADAIAWYARARSILVAHLPGAVLVSGDSNPEEVAFVGAARDLEIPQVFVSHAYPTPFSPPLDFTLSILEGEAEMHARRRKGPIKGAVLLVGMEGDSAPLDARRFQRSSPVIGIFPPKALSWPVLAAIVADCRHRFQPRQIIIRWHPSMIEPPRLSRVLDDRSGIVEYPGSVYLPDVARQCDWVIAAGNSNVHLPILKLGIPTVAVSGLGVYPESRSDLYGFVANRIIFPPVKSIRDVNADALIGFFAEPWATRFAQYDAAYLRPRSAIGTEVRSAIWELFESRTSRAAVG